MRNSLRINIYISTKDITPSVELRRCITDKKIMQDIIRAAMDQRTILVKPTFPKNEEAISNLVQNGIIEKKGKEFYFLK